MTRTALLALAGLIAVASPAHADIKFVGQSRASPQLKHDVLTMIASYAKGVHACGTLATVESAPLGDTYEPKTPMYRVAEPGRLYERWVADLCGTKRAFLVALWPSPKGGTDFKVVAVPPGTDP
jgi:hypothetical protein